jgi:hypothetical protein
MFVVARRRPPRGVILDIIGPLENGAADDARMWVWGGCLEPGFLDRSGWLGTVDVKKSVESLISYQASEGIGNEAA